MRSIPSPEPHNLDDSNAGGSIYAPRPRLRALWTLWSGEVRVLSGALRKPCIAGLSLWTGGECGSVRGRGPATWQLLLGTDRPVRRRYPRRSAVNLYSRQHVAVRYVST